MSPLAPGAWDFYALSLSDSFSRTQSSLAIEWLVVDPREGNYSNALMAFNQGAFPRWGGGGAKERPRLCVCAMCAQGRIA